VTEPNDQLPDTDPLTREAIAWVVRLTSGEATVADAEELRRWRAQSAAHEAAFRRAAKLWRGFADTARASQPERFQLSTWRPNRLTRRALLGGGAAAAALAATYIVVKPPLGLWPSWNEMLADYRTEKGESRRIAISPEVSVELNTLTSVSVRSEVERPTIDLIAGEAVFTARTTEKPLVVVADDVTILASQATFSARCIDGIVSVTCIVGSVDVGRGASVRELHVGQRVTYSTSGAAEVADVDVAEATSWRSGMLVFHNKPLAEVVEEINRYRPGRIVVTNDELGRRVVNGTFRRDQLDSFVAQVQQLFGAKVTSLPAGLTLLS
jgi:transmembrane sensor